MKERPWYNRNMDICKYRIIYLYSVILLAVIFAGLGIYNYSNAKVKVEWETGSEISTAGFNIYRSKAVGSEQNKVNNEVIQPSDDAWTGGKYIYIDEGVKPGITYYYYLEDIDTSGNVTRHGPIEVKTQKVGVIEFFFTMTLIGLALIGYFASRPGCVLHKNEYGKVNHE